LAHDRVRFEAADGQAKVGVGIIYRPDACGSASRSGKGDFQVPLGPRLDSRRPPSGQSGQLRRPKPDPERPKRSDPGISEYPHNGVTRTLMGQAGTRISLEIVRVVNIYTNQA